MAIHKDDVGTVFEITLVDQDGVVVDVSAATAKSIVFRKPDGLTVLTKVATLTTDGSDGKLQYASIAGDLDTLGEWQMQGDVTLGSSRWRSDVTHFKVYANLA